MFLKQTLILLALTLMAGTALAEDPRGAIPGPEFNGDLAPQLDTGLKVKYQHYGFFVKNDRFAVDVRVHNFYNGRSPTQAYLYLNDSSNAHRDQDMLGIPLPIGVVIGSDKKFQAYIQAEPNFDLHHDKDVTAGGAVGIRFRF